MTCREVQESIEAVAAGDEPASDAFRTHVEGCLRCAAAFARARRIEETLARRPAPPAPARFSAAVAARIRREYWRSEQQVDRFFNVAIAIGLVAILGGALAIVNLTTVTSAMAGIVAVLHTLATESGSRAVEQSAPVLSTYLLAGGFLLTALLVWWWAEKRRSLDDER
jgi:anti-sigma factor RsiW